VERTWTIFRDRNAACGYVLTRTDTPGGREADVRRLQVLSELIFGNPGSLRSNGKQLQYSQRHLQHARRFEEIKDVVERWLRME